MSAATPHDPQTDAVTRAPAGAPAVRLQSVEEAVVALKRGLPVLVADDADRENEGDVVIAAEHATPEWIAWTVRHSSGVLCAPMPAELADRLGLPPMVARNEDARCTAYTVSVDAREGVTTGISAADRSRTARLLADPETTAADLVRPGHMFPLRARDGGVLERTGHTEAAVDLCRLAGLAPVAVICELVHDDGAVMRLPALRELADRFELPLITVADLVEFRRRQGDSLAAPAAAAPEAAALAGADRDAAARVEPVEPVERVERVATTHLPTSGGDLTAVGYRDLRTGAEHVVLLSGEPADGMLVRVHSECLTGDAFGSLRCDCGPQLDAAIAAVTASGGAVVYLGGHEGRGIGLLAKLSAYALQDEGLDTIAANVEQGLPADAREYGAAAAILADLGVGSVRLLTNNPAKIDGLGRHGIAVTERLPLIAGHGPRNQAYLQAKRDLMGHLMDVGGEPRSMPDHHDHHEHDHHEHDHDDVAVRDSEEKAG